MFGLTRPNNLAEAERDWASQLERPTSSTFHRSNLLYATSAIPVAQKSQQACSVTRKQHEEFAPSGSLCHWPISNFFRGLSPAVINERFKGPEPDQECVLQHISSARTLPNGRLHILLCQLKCALRQLQRAIVHSSWPCGYL